MRRFAINPANVKYGCSERKVDTKKYGGNAVIKYTFYNGNKNKSMTKLCRKFICHDLFYN